MQLPLNKHLLQPFDALAKDCRRLNVKVAAEVSFEVDQIFILLPSCDGQVQLKAVVSWDEVRAALRAGRSYDCSRPCNIWRVSLAILKVRALHAY